MNRKDKSKSINRAQKWKQWYIKNTVSDESVALSCYLIKISWSSDHHLFFNLSFLYAKEKPTLENHWYRSTNNVPTLIYPQKVPIALSDENILLPKHLSRLVNKKISLNMNIGFYFLNILASPDVLTWLTTNRHHRKTIERTWQIVNICK